jgi:hypothetical protein
MIGVFIYPYTLYFLPKRTQLLANALFRFWEPQ